MSTQSLPHPSRCIRAPLRIVLSVLLSLLPASLLLGCLLLGPQTSAQTSAETFTQTSALAAPLLLPSAIIFDAAGNLYLAEAANHVIRKVDITGQITTIAGSGIQGFSGDNGPATAAQLDSPQGLALDTAGNLYLADTHNHRIRKLNLATGTLITIAGSTPGFSGDNAAATAAQLNLPTALALDAVDNLYFADTGNHRIRRIDAATGVISTAAGDGTQGFSGDYGPAISAAIDSPTGLAIHANILYMADTHNHRIRAVNLTTGTISTLAGTGALGFSGDTTLAAAAVLALPHGLTVDFSGNLYIADTENHRIRRIDAITGQITTVAGTGVQGFSGDNGPATSASLDSPRAASFSPNALLTLADTGNQRIRQLDATPAPGPDIHTIAGLGVTVPGALTLTAPPVIAYGSGQIIAALATSSPATGSIVFLDTADAGSSTLATVPLVANTAILPTASLSAGSHDITATYSGDQTHLSAQSAALAFRIAQQALTASIASLTLTYGQPIPTLAGTISGVLPQDAGNVSAFFSTPAAALSSAGVYPIAATLTGSAAGNYLLPALSATITITPASTATALGNLVASAAAGSALTVTTRVASTAASILIGTVTLLDAATPLATIALPPTGLATFSNLSLSPGIHTLTALYNGSANFTPSASTPQQIIILAGNPNPAPPPTQPIPPATADFTLTATGASTQTILSGSSASFTLAVQPQGSMSSPVTLAATGLPNLATASFNPPTIPPASAPTPFTLTIATPQTTASNYVSPPVWAFFFLPVLGLALRPRSRDVPAKLLTLALLSTFLIAASGCGNRVNVASSATVAASRTYPITVTGTSTTSTGAILQHSTTVTLILQPAS